ncbi:MAG: hypothetical protein ACJ746_06040 [Bryobacteraceae bacterium]
MNERSFPNRVRPFSLGIHLIAGTVGVLAGLHHLLSAKDRIHSARTPVRTANAVSGQSLAERATRRHYFSIRRTKSELGYVYWVLQGHGEFQCFVLFDTWREAVDEAFLRASDRLKEHCFA